MRRWRSLALLPFVLAALCLAILTYRLSQTIGDGAVVLLGIPLVALLALGGLVMNLIPRRGKRKSHETRKLRQDEFDPDSEYTLTDDGRL